MTAPIPGERRLEKLLADQAKRLTALEDSVRSTQLGFSSIHNAYIKAYDAQDQARMLLGRQHDGTFGVTYANGPQPVAPAGLIAGPRQLSVVLGWDGTFVGGVAKPGDFARVDFHMAETAVYDPDGTTVVGQLTAEGALTVSADNVTHYVKAVVVSTSDVVSAVIDVGSVLPLPAGVIAAGVIGAEQLAATVVLASSIILGDPAAERLEIDPLGIAQFSETGSETLRIGASSVSGNFLTVVDPGDSSRTLASIGADGVITASGFKVTGDVNIGGTSLDATLDLRPRGIVGWMAVNGNSPTTTGQTGWFECRFTAYPGRQYKFHMAPVTAKGNGFGMFLRRTTDGSTPTTSSPAITYVAAANDSSAQFAVMDRFDAAPSTGWTVRVLVTVMAFQGTSVWAEDTGQAAHTQMWIEDIGPAMFLTTGQINSGGGTAAATVRQYTSEWIATWSGTWNPGTSNLVRGTGDEMIQGYISGGAGGGDSRSAFGFNGTHMRGELAGATIHSISLYLYAKHWYFNDGGFARIGTHNGLATGTYPGTSARIAVPKMAKPQALWIGLSTTVGNQLRDNTVQGFSLDATDVSRNLLDYGKFDGAGQANAPRVKITYSK